MICFLRKSQEENNEEEKIQPKFKKDKTKNKKTCSNFYETHNAKNRSRKRQQGDELSDNDDNGAKKKKKKTKKR